MAEQMIRPCHYCVNASVVDDLGHDEDLRYNGLVLYDNYFRVFFRTGDRKPTAFTFDLFDGHWCCDIAQFVPRFCPFCGRELIENKLYSVKE